MDLMRADMLMDDDASRVNLMIAGMVMKDEIEGSLDLRSGCGCYVTNCRMNLMIAGMVMRPRGACFVSSQVRVLHYELPHGPDDSRHGDEAEGSLLV